MTRAQGCVIEILQKTEVYPEILACVVEALGKCSATPEIQQLWDEAQAELKE